MKRSGLAVVTAVMVAWVVGLGIGSAQDPIGPPDGGDFDPLAEVAGELDQPVTIGAAIEPGGGGKPDVLTVTATLEEGWHLYSVTQKPGGPLATRITVAADSPRQAAGPFVPGEPPHVRTVDEVPAWKGLPIEEHAGTVVWRAPRARGRRCPRSRAAAVVPGHRLPPAANDRLRGYRRGDWPWRCCRKSACCRPERRRSGRDLHPGAVACPARGLVRPIPGRGRPEGLAAPRAAGPGSGLASLQAGRDRGDGDRPGQADACTRRRPQGTRPVAAGHRGRGGRGRGTGCGRRRRRAGADRDSGGG